MASPDFIFTDHGSITMVRCTGTKALEHLHANTDEDVQWSGAHLAVEPRYAADLSAQLCRDGFAVELPDGRVVTAADLRED